MKLRHFAALLVFVAVASTPAIVPAQTADGQQVEFERRMAEAEKLRPKVGEVFPDFEGATYDGKPLKLSDFRGKVTVVDFWATWCGPCRAEIPNMREVYAAYHEKGMEILGVSLDKPGDALRKFYESPETSIPWQSTFEGKYWDSDLAKRFGIMAIPAMFVLDKDGKVIAADVRGTGLWRAVMSQLDPGATPPPDISEALKKWIGAPDEERAVIAAELAKWAPKFQSELSEIAWNYLDSNQPTAPNAAGAALVLGLLAPTVAQDDAYSDLDTAALAAHLSGNSKMAAELQRRVVELLVPKVRESGAKRGKAFESKDPVDLFAETGDSGLLDILARLALYEAASGNTMEAKRIHGMLGAMKDSKYGKMTGEWLNKVASN